MAKRQQRLQSLASVYGRLQRQAEQRLATTQRAHSEVMTEIEQVLSLAGFGAELGDVLAVNAARSLARLHRKTAELEVQLKTDRQQLLDCFIHHDLTTRLARTVRQYEIRLQEAAAFAELRERFSATSLPQENEV